MRTPLLMLSVALAACASAMVATAASAADSERLEEVTVTAQRAADLAPRVAKFVSQIAALENNEGLPRWQIPVCPLVRGLPPQEGEFVLERLSEIARAAAVPLAGARCRPNLYIVVSSDPVYLLRNMTLHNYLMAFGSISPAVVDAWIATPRIVRVWYKTSMATAFGVRIGDTYPVPPPAPEDFPVIWEAESTHLNTNVIYGFSTVLVVVDQSRLPAVTRGQFADYVAMVSLAKLKPGASLGDAPTILKLFDGTPQAALAGMSEWDQAFLKALYVTEQKSKLQRNLMTHVIVREIAH